MNKYRRKNNLVDVYLFVKNSEVWPLWLKGAFLEGKLSIMDDSFYIKNNTTVQCVQTCEYIVHDHGELSVYSPEHFRNIYEEVELEDDET